MQRLSSSTTANSFSQRLLRPDGVLLFIEIDALYKRMLARQKLLTQL